MNCPNCKNNLPDDALFCNLCGETTAAAAPPQPAPQPGTVCPHCRANLPPGIQICFRCGKPISAMPQPIRMPAPGYSDTVPRAKKNPAAAAVAAVLAVVLLLGGTVGGHFLGFYTLPLLPERGVSAEAALPLPPGGTQTPEQSPGISGGTGQIIGTTPQDWEAVRLEPLYILPRAEIHLDSENPMRGTVTIKGFEVPRTVTLGHLDPESWQEYVYIGVSFACNDGYAYMIAINEFAGMDRDGRRDVALSDLQPEVWQFDVNTGTGQSGFGHAWIEQVTCGSVVMGFEIFSGAVLDFSRIKYIGYDFRIYGDINNESGVYDRSIESTGEWTLIEGVDLGNYMGANQEFYREQRINGIRADEAREESDR